MTGAFLTGVLGLRVAYDTLGSWASTVIGIDAWVTSRGVMAIPGAHSGSGDAVRALATDHTPTLRNMPVGVAAFVAFEFDLSRARKYRGRHRGPQL